MFKKNNVLSWIPSAMSVAFLIGAFQYGPTDLWRAVYNGITGDTPVLKRQIGNYIVCKENEKHPLTINGELESKLSNELNIPLVDGKLDFRQAALDDLFDASERRSGTFDSYVWLRLDDYKNPDCGCNNSNTNQRNSEFKFSN